MIATIAGDPIPSTGFAVIAMDPPWLERGAGKIKRGADKHYDLLKTSDILAAILRAEAFQPADDSLLFCWTTMSSLPDALWLVDGLGFRYVTHGVWVKARADLGGGLDIGIGQYFRGAHELFLVASRGSGFAVKSDARDIPSVIIAPSPRADGKRVHSRKPTKFFEMVEKRTVGPKLEMFARAPYGPGWTSWGTHEHALTDGDHVADESDNDKTAGEHA